MVPTQTWPISQEVPAASVLTSVVHCLKGKMQSVSLRAQRVVYSHWYLLLAALGTVSPNTCFLNWVQLNWIELNWIELNWAELNWIELSWIELNWTELNWIELNWIELNWTELSWIELNWIELNWTELNWVELNWIELNWIELNSIQPAPKPGGSPEPKLAWNAEQHYHLQTRYNSSCLPDILKEEGSGTDFPPLGNTQ